MRDSATNHLDLDASLVPSYIFKSVLLSRYFAAGEESKEKEYWLEQVENTLSAVLQGIMHGDIQNFFLSGYNLLSTIDHRNKLRQFIVENMLSLVRGLKMTHTREEVRETKRQIRVLEIVDIRDFLLFEGLDGRDTAALWQKLFVNIYDVPSEESYEVKFSNQITNLDRLDLDEDVYEKLVQEWSALEYIFDQLIAVLPEDLEILARKFYIRTWEKRKKFEQEHKDNPAHPIQQLGNHEVVCQHIVEYAENYFDGKGNTAANCYSNLHKALPPDYRSLGLLRDIANITLQEGSDRGRAVFKDRVKQYMSLVPESVLMSVVVGYLSQIFFHSKNVLRRKLDYINIPEVDLD